MPRILSIDFETYYDTEYSLGKMATQSYILDPLFELIGVSVAVGNNPPAWFAGTRDETETWLREFEFEDKDTITVAHNAQFDGAILEWVLDIHPARYFCTMMGARPYIVPFTPRQSASLKVLAEYCGLPEKGTEVVMAKGLRQMHFTPSQMISYAGYCNRDVELTRALFFKLWEQFPEDELDLIDLTVKKFTRPVIELNEAMLMLALIAHQGDKAMALTQAGLDDRGPVMSNNKFAVALENMGVTPPTKFSPTTGKVTWAFAKTDKGMQELLRHPMDKVRWLAEARLVNKSTLTETRLESFIKLAHTNKALGVPLLYYGATTGRYSGSGGLNLQNIPRGSALRKAMEAPKGYTMISGDLSQVEARVMATLARETHLEEAFRNEEDVYSNFAEGVYGYAVSKETPEERAVGKVSVLQLQYGSGAVTLQMALSNSSPPIIIPETESQRIVQVYRHKHPHIVDLWNKGDYWLRVMVAPSTQFVEYAGLCIYNNYNGDGPAIVLPNGMPIYYPELYRDGSGEYHYKHKNAWVKLYGSKLIQNVVQALARIIITDAELFLAKKGYPAAASIHDELLFAIIDAKAEVFKKVLAKVLVRPPAFMPTVPLACEVNSGRSYADCK